MTALLPACDSLAHSLLAVNLSASHLPPLPSSARTDAIGWPCRLLAVPAPVRTLVLDQTDDLTAIRYHSTCRSLHAGYHCYPLKRGMPEAALRALTLDAAAFGCCFSWLRCFPRRVNCCAPRGTWCGWCCQSAVLPRIERLQASLRDVRLLPYLRHVTELTIVCSDKDQRLISTSQLPHSLRTLHLTPARSFDLEHGWLPPRLSTLSLCAIKNMTPLPAGVLPPSLTSLHFRCGFSNWCPIGEGVLPAGLRRLEVDEWSLPLSSLALPASLVELTVRRLANFALPALPPQLEVLCIGGVFSQSLMGVLPATLRVLELLCEYEWPISGKEFGCTPWLDRLYLNERSTELLVAANCGWARDSTHSYLSRRGPTCACSTCRPLGVC